MVVTECYECGAEIDEHTVQCECGRIIDKAYFQDSMRKEAMEEWRE